MRLLVTADLHFNHPRSREPAIEVIETMNKAGGDGVLLVGDTSVADGAELEECLQRFTIRGPRLFLCGNHELWTMGSDSHELFVSVLPTRVRAMGWQWLEDEPFVAPGFAIAGSIGWYDYGFASSKLAIPKRFYEAKLSPGAALNLRRNDLEPEAEDVSPEARKIVAGWNDGKFVKLHRTDQEFLDECVSRLFGHLERLAHIPQIIVATHHLPFRELLPTGHSSQIEFVKAYLGSERMGEMIRQFPNVREVYCGHSHFAARATIGGIEAINIGSSYRHKEFHMLELPD